MITPEDLRSFAAGVAAQVSPPEVELRRAVSSMYYALFHALAAASARRFDQGGAALRNQVVRAHSHSTMRRVCERYLRSRQRPFPPALDTLNEPAPSGSLAEVADAFIGLQEARHSADYDLTAEFGTDDVNALALTLGNALDALQTIERQQATVIFLAALLLDDRWGKRG